MSNGVSSSIEKLNRENYDTWKMQMKAILVKDDLWEYADGTISKPQAADEASLWNERDGKAQNDIILAMSSSELCHVKHCKTSHEIWNKLKEIYEPKGPARKATLLKQLLFTKMSGNENMSDHLNNFFSHVDDLKEMDIGIDDDLLSILLLYSVPNTYENFRCAIESLDQLPTPHVLRTKLLEEANFRRNSNAASDHQEALQVDSNKYKRYVKNRNSLNKNGLTKANKVKHIECFYCHKRGHKANQCLKKKNDDHKAQLAQVPEIPNTEQCLHTFDIQDEDNQGNSIITIFR